MPRPRLQWAMLAVAVAASAALYAATAALPYFSESLSHQVRVERFASAWQIFDPSEVPFRPLQHAFFYLMHLCGPVAPAAARVPAFALHVASALLVARLARELGCTPRGQWIALLGFLCFPSVKALVWVAAISGPSRVACVLAGLCLFLRHVERPRAATGLGLVAAQILAIGFHQSGIFLAPLCALFLWAKAGGPLGAGLPRALARLLDPWFLAALAIAAGFALAMTYLFPKGYPKSVPEAIAANVARACLALWPEALRFPAIEGLRRQSGDAGFALGIAAVLASAAILAAILWRGSAALRALTAAAALDLLLPALTVGFVVRYAYLASAFAACALGLWWSRAAPRRASAHIRGAITAVLLIGWECDSAIDVREYRAAGRVAERVLAQAAAARAEAGPGVPVALVDLPDNWGRERDIPFFNWGTERGLELRGAAGPWLFLRTRPTFGSSEFAPISTGELARLEREAGHPVLVWEPERRELVRRDAGAPARGPGGPGGNGS